MKFFHRTARYVVLDLERNAEILEELGVKLVQNKI